MRVRIPCGVVLVFLAVVFHASPASACECVNPGCGVTKIDVIFEATVESVEISSMARGTYNGRPVPGREVRLRDVRGLRGRTSDVVVTGFGGADCGYDFAVGVRYLIVAYERDGRLETSICSRTQPITAAVTSFLQYVRSLTAPSRGGSIWGRVLTQGSTEAQRVDSRLAAQPIASAQVTISGSDERTATTGVSGEFSFTALPPGEYTVTVKLPESRKDLAPIAPLPAFRLDGAYACAEHDFWAMTTSRVEGALVDEDGAPVPGYLMYLMPVGWNPSSGPRPQGETTDGSGRYRFANVAPGRYVVGISVYLGPSPAKPFATTFGRDPSGHSELVIPASGGSIDVEPMVLRRLVPQRVQGTVVWSSGDPAAGIELTADFVTEHGLVRSPMMVNTGPDGTFAFDAFAGHRYRFRLARGGRVIDRAEVVVTGEPIAITLRTP